MIVFFETDQYSIIIQEEGISYKLFSQFLGRKYIKVPNNLLSTIDCLLSILIDIKENFTETHLFQSRNIQSHENLVSRQERYSDKTTVQVHIKPSSRQAQFLDIIRKNPSLTRRKISERFDIKRGYVNGTVPRLKKHHLIKEKENRKLFIIS